MALTAEEKRKLKAERLLEGVIGMLDPVAQHDTIGLLHAVAAVILSGQEARTMHYLQPLMFQIASEVLSNEIDLRTEAQKKKDAAEEARASTERS